MKHKYQTFRFVNGKLVCEWEEEEIKPILYLNDYYNFLDTDEFENAYNHGKGSKNYIYEVLEKHLNALEIIKEKRVDVYHIQATTKVSEYNLWKLSTSKRLKKKEYDLLKEVRL
jgi:hypothetical protein